MDRTDKLLTKYTLNPNIKNLEEIRNLLHEEMAIENLEDHEYLKTLCFLLFIIGDVNDSILIWKAKNKDFDAVCYIDGEFLCGAGLKETKVYLAN